MVENNNQNILSQIKTGSAQLIENKFGTHPFANKVNESNVYSVMSNYIVMSQGFPCVQAGAIYKLFLSSMAQNVSLDKAAELTSAVAAFLVSDEFGVHDTVLHNGNKGLPKILNTEDQFHVNLLKRDTGLIFGDVILPDYSKITTAYLLSLCDGLANPNSVARVAAMVAFEKHASIMIDSLWTSLTSIFSLNKESLSYFRKHVGGDDPAETYHVEMTEKLITYVITKDQITAFLASFEEYYALNFNWCSDITNLQDKKLAA